MASIWKLLTLLAVLLLPLNMSSAQANAPVAGMTMGHCPDQDTDHDGKNRMAACTMACAAALPAVDAPAGDQLRFASNVGSTTTVETLHGLEPEIATPPPKLA